MSIPKTQKSWNLKKYYAPGVPFSKDFVSYEENHPVDSDLKDGEVLIKNIYTSVDPIQINWLYENPSYTEKTPIGNPIPCQSCGEIVDSKSSKYKKGDLVFGFSGFQEYTKVHESKVWWDVKPVIKNHPLISAVSTFGMTTLTAYFGIIDLAKVKEGETVVISGAAGATGVAVGLIAKIKGAKVYGLAGTDEKCKNLVEKYGFDGAINYKREDLKDELKKVIPQGVDIYFDNVGPPLSDIIIPLINNFARVILCGFISSYQSIEIPPLFSYPNILFKSGEVKGMFIPHHLSKSQQALTQLNEWVEQKKFPVNFPVTLYHGVEEEVDALINLFTGKNEGKSIIQVSSYTK